MESNFIKPIKAKYTLIYVILMYLMFFGKFVITKIGISAPPLINYIFIIASIFLFFPYQKKYNNLIIGSSLLFVLYIVFKFIFWGMPIISSIVYYSTCIFICIFLIPIVEKLEQGLIDINKIKKHFYIIFICEVLLALLQYFVPPIFDFFYIDSYSWNGVIVESGFLDVLKSDRNLVGTFLKPQSYSNIMALFICVAAMDLLSNKSKVLSIKGIFFILAFVTLLLAGTRTPFLMAGLSMLIVVYKYRKPWFKYVLALISFFVIIFLAFNIGDESSNVYRIQSGLAAVFSGDISQLEEQTIGYSFFMIPYFLTNPIFGVTLGNGYILGIRYTLEEFSHTDIQFIYTFCELGIIGVFIMVLPLIIMIHSKEKKDTFSNITPILLLSLLLTIVDDTLFTWEVKILLALAIVFTFHIKH